MRAVKKSKAKKNSTAITTEEKEEQKAVVVIPSTEEGEEAVLTKDENFIEKKPAGKRRLGQSVIAKSELKLLAT